MWALENMRHGAQEMLGAPNLLLMTHIAINGRKFAVLLVSVCPRKRSDHSICFPVCVTDWQPPPLRLINHTSGHEESPELQLRNAPISAARICQRDKFRWQCTGRCLCAAGAAARA
jgi:hypothetical protein